MKNIEIDPKDLRWDSFSSAGGLNRSLSKIEASIKLTHLPTGICVSADSSNSEYVNREEALLKLKNELQKLDKTKVYDHNIYDTLYAQARYKDLTLGSTIYFELLNYIKDNPEKFPWEHELNKYPNKVLTDYSNEMWPSFDLENDNENSSVGIMDFFNEAKVDSIDLTKSFDILEIL